MRSVGAGSFARAETQRVRPIAAIPSNETYLMTDTRAAGASIFEEVLIRVLQTIRLWHQ